MDDFLTGQSITENAARSGPSASEWNGLWRGTWGAHPLDDGNFQFAIWAPDVATGQLRLDGEDHQMTKDAEGFWRWVGPAKPGQHYGFVLDGRLYADPASRQQADVLDGPSVVIGPPDFYWHPWSGRPFEEAVFLEVHIGTFTKEGTLAAATRMLPTLASTGITAIELMPLSHFPGRWGWGYDGSLLGAIHPAYGTPDDLRRFVDAAHKLEMMVVLDLVLNHFGPDDNYLPSYVPGFFTNEATPWGHAIDYAKPQVRALMKDIALRWIAEYHLDGLRLDAVHEIRDPSEPHFLTELVNTMHARDWGRPVHLVAEDERNIPDLIEAGFAAQWNDDWHHAFHVLLTGEHSGHLRTFELHALDDIVRALSHGQVEQGQKREGRERLRGKPAGHLPWHSFVNANMSHDQVGNRPWGERQISLLGEPRARFLHALLLVMPFTPLLFQGEEIGSERPFLFFADYTGEIAANFRAGRIREMYRYGHESEDMADPMAFETLARSRPYVDPPLHAPTWRELTRQALAFRQARIVPLLRSGKIGEGDVTLLGPRAVRARWAFAAGTLEVAFSIGGTPEYDLPEGDPDWRLGQLAKDDFAVEVRIR